MPPVSQRYRRPPPRRYSSRSAVPPSRRLLQSLVVIAVLTVAKTAYVERTVIGNNLELAAVNMMQSLLSPRERSNVAVVDIATIPMKTDDEGGETQRTITSRKDLLTALQSVAATGPAAIGVDILFEPDQFGRLSVGDISFLEGCLALTRLDGTHIPTFVGIDQLARGETGWLGEPRFGQLGKTVLIPRNEESLMPTEDLIRTLTLPVGDRQIEADSMSLALAQALDGALRGPVRNWFAESVSTKVEEGIALHRYRLDYGPLSTLIQQRVPWQAVADRTTDLKDRVVLIGRATIGETNDMFSVAAHGEPVPGVFLHAVGVETLLKPLYTLTRLGQVFLDIALAAVTALLLYSLDLLCWRKFDSEREDHTYEIWAKRCEIGVALLVLASGFVVTVTRLFWTDYLMVALALFLHGSFEKFFKWIYRSAEQLKSRSAA